MNKKDKKQDIAKVFMAFTHTKKVYLLRPGSGSVPRRPDSDPTKEIHILSDPDPQHWAGGHSWQQWWEAKALTFCKYLCRAAFPIATFGRSVK
jgi:hypothetical protein